MSLDIRQKMMQWGLRSAQHDSKWSYLVKKSTISSSPSSAQDRHVEEMNGEDVSKRLEFDEVAAVPLLKVNTASRKGKNKRKREQ